MKQDNRGFSLLEMMIVLAIIGILSAVMIPSFGAIIQKTKESGVKAVAHQLQVTMENYRLSQGHYPSGSLQAADLITTLQADGDLKTPPKNPFTGKAYSSSDASGKILYESQDGGSTYTLDAYGKGNEAVILEVKGE